MPLNQNTMLAWFTLGFRPRGEEQIEGFHGTLLPLLKARSTDPNAVFSNESMLTRLLSAQYVHGEESQRPYFAAAQALLDKGADPWLKIQHPHAATVHQDGYGPLFLALAVDSWALIGRMLRHPNRPDWDTFLQHKMLPEGLTLAEEIVKRPEFLPTLIEAGLDPRWVEPRPPHRPLLFRTSNPEQAHWLIAQGADPMATDSRGRTVLAYKEDVGLNAEERKAWSRVLPRVDDAHLWRAALSGQAKVVTPMFTHRDQINRWRWQPTWADRELNILDAAALGAINDNGVRHGTSLVSDVLARPGEWPQESLDLAAAALVAKHQIKDQEDAEGLLRALLHAPHAHDTAKALKPLSLAPHNVMAGIEAFMRWSEHLPASSEAPFRAWHRLFANDAWRSEVLDRHTAWLSADLQRWDETCFGDGYTFDPDTGLATFEDTIEAMAPQHRAAIVGQMLCRAQTRHGNVPGSPQVQTVAEGKCRAELVALMPRWLEAMNQANLSFEKTTETRMWAHLRERLHEGPHGPVIQAFFREGQAHRDPLVTKPPRLKHRA